jgi:hypothetical protein
VFAQRWIPARPSWRISLGVVGLVCFALGCAAVVQHDIGWNEYSHFAQVRAFDRGTPIIDRYRHTTGDRAIYHHHFYSDKAPGLGFYLTPVYHVARAIKLVRPKGFITMHLLVLFACTLPALIIMLLSYWLIREREAGPGALTALTLGFGTMLLPFSTILFSHVFSACLGFAAFCLLWRERELGRGGLPAIAGAGLLAGYAISSEYPLGLLALLLGCYVAWRPQPARPLATYAAGVLVGLIPLLLYDWWAFGSPFHLSYSYVAANASGVLGLGAPSVNNALRLVFADRGLFIVNPVTAAALAGIVILYREGRRRDALVPAVVIAAYLAYNACYYLPFGGGVPGPRFLVTILPFLAVPLAAAYRRAPLATLALAVVSAATMAAATFTVPILSTVTPTSIWWRRLAHGHFSTPTVCVVLFAIFALGAILLVARATPRPRISRLDLELTVLGLGSWWAFRQAAPAMFAQDLASGHVWGLAALGVLALALIIVILRVARGRQLALVAAIPILLLGLRRFDHTTIAICLALVALALVLAVSWRARSAAHA